MSRARVAVLQIVSNQLSVTEAAAEYGFSRRHLHRLLARYRQGGLDAVQQQSRRPKSSPHATPDVVRDRIVELRRQLTADASDAGPVTIAWHLAREGLAEPSTSTIRRVLHDAGLIVPEPRKRPRSSYLRFEAAQPNEMWQSDATHWRLADGTDVEVLNWLDDHSRYLLSATAHQPVTGDDVVAVFLDVVGDHGPPASTLTDNARIYTARFGGGRNAFELSTSSRCSASARRTDPPDTPKPKARSSGSIKPRNAGWPPAHQSAPSPSYNASSISSASTTTSGAHTARWTGLPQATPTAPPPRPLRPPTATPNSTTACATTAWTPKAA